MTMSLVVAGSFAALGFWPILPFAGLELALLGWALNTSMRRGRYREIIQVDDSLIRVEKRHGRRRSRIDFQTPWTRLELISPGHRGWPSQLTLNSMGQRVEIGQFLTECERQGLATRLGAVIGPRQPLRFAAPRLPEFPANNSND